MKQACVVVMGILAGAIVLFFIASFWLLPSNPNGWHNEDGAWSACASAVSQQFPGAEPVRDYAATIDHAGDGTYWIRVPGTIEEDGEAKRAGWVCQAQWLETKQYQIIKLRRMTAE
jgi:hypothetical protein